MQPRLSAVTIYDFGNVAGACVAELAVTVLSIGVGNPEKVYVTPPVALSVTTVFGQIDGEEAVKLGVSTVTPTEIVFDPGQPPGKRALTENTVVLLIKKVLLLLAENELVPTGLNGIHV